MADWPNAARMPRDTNKRPFWLLSQYEKLFHGSPKRLEFIWNILDADGWTFDPDIGGRRTIEADIESTPQPDGILVFRELPDEPITIGVNFELPGYSPVQRTSGLSTLYRLRPLIITPVARYEFAQSPEPPDDDSPLWGAFFRYSAFMCLQDRTGDDVLGQSTWVRQLVDGVPSVIRGIGTIELYYRADDREFFDDPRPDPFCRND